MEAGFTAKWIMVFCLAMALISASVYALLASGVVEVGDMSPEGGVPAFFYIIPASYVIGGILIFLKKRGLWIVGAVLNVIPIVVFYAAYAGRPDVMLSAPGLVSKVAQILLEIGLIYLIVMAKRTEAGNR